MIRRALEAGILTLTLDRADKANALTRDMLAELRDAVAETDAKAIILTGEGKVFSAGADLEAARAGLATDPVWEELSQAIADYPGLSIAALNGTLAGGAFGMALACDLRVCVAQANFFYPVMKLGFLPQPSDPSRLRALVGPARAKLILMAGQKVPAERALDWGLIDAISAPDELMSIALSWTEAVSAANADHIAAIKALSDAG